MATDPYGYPTDQPERPPGGWWGTAIGASLLCFAFAACCMGGDLLVMSATPEVGSDWIGVALLLSFPMWPALGVGIMTLGLYSGTQRGWVLLGPNVILGSTAGLVIWLALFLSAVTYDVVTGG